MLSTRRPCAKPPMLDAISPTKGNRAPGEYENFVFLTTDLRELLLEIEEINSYTFFHIILDHRVFLRINKLYAG